MVPEDTGNVFDALREFCHAVAQANTAYEQGNIDVATTLYARALAARERLDTMLDAHKLSFKLEDTRNYPAAHIGMLILEARLNVAGDQRTSFEHAALVATRSGDPYCQLEVLQAYSRFLIEQQQYDKAIDLLNDGMHLDIADNFRAEIRYLHAVANIRAGKAREGHDLLRSMVANILTARQGVHEPITRFHLSAVAMLVCLSPWRHMHGMRLLAIAARVATQQGLAHTPEFTIIMDIRKYGPAVYCMLVKRRRNRRAT